MLLTKDVIWNANSAQQGISRSHLNKQRKKFSGLYFSRHSVTSESVGSNT